MKKFDKCFIGIFLITVILCTLISSDDFIINVLGMNINLYYVFLVSNILGVCYVTFVRLQNKYAMLIGAAFSLCYAAIGLVFKNYGDFSTNVFAMCCCLYGIFGWNKNDGKLKSLENKNKILAIYGSSVVLFITMFLILSTIGSHNLLLDSILSTFIIISNILMMLSYKECFIFFLYVNVLHSLLWFYRVCVGVPNATAVCLMFVFYSLNSIIALRQLYK